MSESSRARRRWLSRGAVVLALAVVVWLVWQGFFGQAPNKATAAPAVPATLVTVSSEDVPHYLLAVGTVQPLASVTVRTRVDGELQRLGYVEGQDVKAGQMLAEIDAKPYQAQLGQALAQKARDEAQLANAKRDFDRYAELIKLDSTSQQTLDTQKALVAQLQAAVQNDQAQVDYAQVQLGYTTITAPLAGRTGARLVDAGNIVHASDAGGLVVINQIDPIAVVFAVPGDALPEIDRARQGGGALAALAYSRDGEALLGRGELVLVNNQIDVASGTVQLKARFANAAHALWPGQYVNVRLQVGEFRQAPTVPAQVVQRGQSGTYAYVVGADGKAEMRPIEVAQIQDGKAVVGKGLRAGETVVSDGQYKIKPGVPVVAAPGKASAAAEAGK